MDNSQSNLDSPKESKRELNAFQAVSARSACRPVIYGRFQVLEPTARALQRPSGQRLQPPQQDLFRLSFLRTTLVLILAGVLLWACAPNAFPQQSEANLPPPSGEYKGRRIAETMSYHGAPWLIRETRDNEENPRKLLEALQVKKGQTVADVGCGNGFYSLQLAKLVGPEGRVLAVDIQPEMLEMLKQRAADAGINNIKPILSTQADPRLPPGEVDLILLVDVYHEFAYPQRMLQAMRASLAPDGRIALAEYRMEDPAVPIKLLHKMSKRQILTEYTANGLKLVREYDGLPWQHLIFFGRTE